MLDATLSAFMDRLAGRGLSGAESDPSAIGADDPTNRKNMALLIQLRWIAVVGQVVTIVVVHVGFGIALPLGPMAVVLCALILLNLASLGWLSHRADISNRALLVGLVLDVLALTAQLYLSGGATNPFTALYLLQVTLGAVLLDIRSTWALVVLTSACFLGLMLVNRPILAAEAGFADPLGLYLIGMLVCLALDAALLVAFVTRIMRNVRERDARLAALRQHAAEEDHIVRMGLLASGAAHELGTPLASAAVILGDWRRMPTVASDPDLMQDLEEMQEAIQRCKAIVTGILVSTGEARGEAPGVTTVHAFLDDVTGDWRRVRPSAELAVTNRFGADVPIVSDSALKQIVFNVLDNAFEAEPRGISLAFARDGDFMRIEVSDRGPGFAPEMLAQLGKPYRSSKGRQGGGLGLFLVVNVVRKLGGTVTAANRRRGGAVVTLTLPLSRLSPGRMRT